MTRPPARFGGPLARVRYVGASCRGGQHDRCPQGRQTGGARRGDLPCSCSCHADTVAAELAYESTRCRHGEHDQCPALAGELFAEIPGRRDLLAVPCTCECHAFAGLLLITPGR